MSLVAQVLAVYRKSGMMIATGESCTGGMLAAALTDVAGSSDVFDRGFVTYSNAAKTAMLDVPAGMIAEHGAVSEPVAQAMAEGALRHAAAQVAVAITGIAGPGGSATKPEGLVCFALAAHGKPTQVQTVAFGALGRGAVRQAARDHALQMLLTAVPGDKSAV
jgi:nicotinamide-nucleotide amidase